MVRCSGTRRFVFRLSAVGFLIGVVTTSTTVFPTATVPNNERSSKERGAILFATNFTTAQGLGPLFNRTSCSGCHAEPTLGGMGPAGLGTVTRIGKLTPSGFDPMIGVGGPLARSHSVNEQGLPCDLHAGIPSGANVVSIRNAPDLHGLGLIDLIPDSEIAAGAIPRGDGVHGRVHWVTTTDGRRRVGRFGWKADVATLKQFVAEAFRNELGITSPLAPVDIPSITHSRCVGESSTTEDDGSTVEAVAAFVSSLSPVLPADGPAGSELFTRVGCDACHVPSLSLGDRRLSLYSDLLLHDLGSDLDDKVLQGQASGHEWRTTPLWGIGTRQRLLHDARARTIEEAIAAHGGEASKAKERFLALSADARRTLLAFIKGL